MRARSPGPNGAGRNGIEVFKVDGVTIENLTACNFLDGNGSGGNQIWWNGGDGSGVIGMGSYHGAYLTASTTYYSDANSASYGIFASNARGPGVIERSYASNMSDSDFYVGACPDCNAVLRRVHAQNSPQGFSGTNAGGHLVLEQSEWDHNRVGIASTTLANEDRPSPQDGACPGQPGTSCTLIQYNLVHDNNNPNTPAEGIAAGAGRDRYPPLGRAQRHGAANLVVTATAPGASSSTTIRMARSRFATVASRSSIRHHRTTNPRAGDPLLLPLVRQSRTRTASPATAPSATTPTATWPTPLSTTRSATASRVTQT